MGGYDLHSHTVCSDGTTTPEQNVAAALELGLEGLGVTDHDTTLPYARAFAAAEGTRLVIVPGVELSAELDGLSVHVLGYWFDPTDRPLRDEMDRLRNEREHRAAKIVAKLADLGVAVPLERVRAIAGTAPIGRPHIASAVVETGAARDVTEVFDTWLADGGPAYVPKHAVDPVRAVELVVAAGGAAVVAHPGLYGVEDPAAGGAGAGGNISHDTIAAMAAAGMAGIEADHPDHSDEVRDHYRRLGAEHDLVVTGGSDYHGDRKDNRLGVVTTSHREVQRLRERCAGYVAVEGEQQEP